jgi:hypothetical protein
MAIRLIDGSEFIHIPKTGGSWVEAALDACGLIDRRLCHKHADYDRVLNYARFDNRELLKTVWNLVQIKMWRLVSGKETRKFERPVFRFCFVRHPLTWYESYWKYMKALRWNEWGKANSTFDWHPNSTLNGLGSDDFNEFIHNVVQKRPGYVTELYYSYTKPGISFIGKNESLVDDLIYALDSVELSYDVDRIRNLGRVNVSETDSSEIKWDEELRRTVIALELPSLVHFGYMSDDEARQYCDVSKIPPNPALHTWRASSRSEGSALRS